MVNSTVKHKKAAKRETLLEHTIRLMKHRDRTITLEILAKNCDCTTSFLSTLMSPDPPSRPGVNAIQRLYEFLSGKQLNY